MCKNSNKKYYILTRENQEIKQTVCEIKQKTIPSKIWTCLSHAI